LRVYERRQQKLYKAKELIEHKEFGIRIKYIYIYIYIYEYGIKVYPMLEYLIISGYALDVNQ
jgi:hypothetical protein